MTDQQKQPPRREWPTGQRMAYDLIKRHPELLVNVPNPQDILFVIDTVNEPTSKGKPLMARLSRITARVVDFIDAGEKEFMLEWFEANSRHLTLNQSYLLLTQQLLRFEKGAEDYRIAGWDIEEMEPIADRFGYGWLKETKGDVPDIMDDDFQWGRVGQSRINLIQELQRLEAERAQRAIVSQRAQAKQATIDHLMPGGGIHLKPTERATLTVGADGGAALVIEGPDGKRDVPANVLQFPKASNNT